MSSSRNAPRGVGRLRRRIGAHTSSHTGAREREKGHHGRCLACLAVGPEHPTPGGVRVVVGCAPDEMHEIGALTLALFLARRRLDVLYLGGAIPLEDLRGFAQRLGVEAIFLSIAQEARAKQVVAVLSEFEAKSQARVFVGGLAFQSKALRETAGEYFLSLDAHEAADIAAQLLLRQERSPE